MIRHRSRTRGVAAQHASLSRWRSPVRIRSGPPSAHLPTPRPPARTGRSSFPAVTIPHVKRLPLVTVLVLLVPVTVRQIHSMQNLQAHAPQTKEIQQRWKHDKQRQNEELMAFYKENGINPLASCLPLLIQMPVFIILYQVLSGLTAAADNSASLSRFGYGSTAASMLRRTRSTKGRL